MPYRWWTGAEREFLQRVYPDMRTEDIAKRLKRSRASVCGQAAKLGLRKSDEFLADTEKSARLDGKRGASGRFKPGHKPWNTGVMGLPARGRTRDFLFTKGRMPKQWVPIGTEVVTKDGYVKRKVSDGGPAGESAKNWRLVQRLIWEEHNGPIPRGHLVVFKDGDKQNLSIENLELIDRRELARRNTIQRYPPEVVGAIRMHRKLQRELGRHDQKQNG